MNITVKWRRAALLVAIAGLAACAGGRRTGPRYQGPIVQAVSNCADFTVPIYFEPGSAVVTREASQLIAAAHGHTDGCDVTGINVTGLADAPGSADENLGLSKRRARAVTRALSRRGFTGLEFHEHAAGDAGAETRSGQARPLRRRAVVEFHVAPKSVRPRG
ncbi:MAG TPA: OmpA family protein [Caulobacteraceae bacterium]|nr:OmpA family protein [Caulobacteraceae bacterium]